MELKLDVNLEPEMELELDVNLEQNLEQCLKLSFGPGSWLGRELGLEQKHRDEMSSWTLTVGPLLWSEAEASSE